MINDVEKATTLKPKKNPDKILNSFLSYKISQNLHSQPTQEIAKIIADKLKY